MNKQDADRMNKALQTLYEVCTKAQKTRSGCTNCPAKGKGKLCHSGEISCCSPHAKNKKEAEEESKYLCQNGWGLILEKRAEVLEMERMTAKKKAQERDENEGHNV